MLKKHIIWLILLTVLIGLDGCNSSSSSSQATNSIPTGNDFNLTLDVNESTVSGDWKLLTSASDNDGDILTASIMTQGVYGTFAVTGNSLTYVKTVETNESDTGVLEISDGKDAIPVTIKVNALFWKQISAGRYHTVAIKSDGTLWAWGYNGYGQLGDGGTTDRSEPTQESTHATDWLTVSTRNGHTAAIKSDGTLWLWGFNNFGQLGDGSTTSRSVPTQESTHAADWTAVSAGDFHTVAIKSDGTLWAWGANSYGQLGDGNTTNSPVPVQESTHAMDWRTAAAGGSAGFDSHTVAIKSNGTLWAWGANSYGQLGDGSTNGSTVPIQESTQSADWIAAAAGDYHTIAIKSNGTLWAWGFNGNGRLGDGSTTSRSVPTQENTQAADWVGISAGGSHTSAIKSDGTLWSWGANFYGQLGDNSTSSRSVPTQESTLATNWSAVSAGGYHGVAVKSDGTLWSWGANSYGQLGNGSYYGLTPAQEGTGSTDWAAASAGYRHTVAIKTDGTLWGWGFNGYGQLGDGSVTSKLLPVQENSHATDWLSVSAGGGHTVAVKSGGTLWGWGFNSSGQLGDGSTINRSVPTQENTFAADWRIVSAGNSHTVAIKSDSTLWAWGADSDGQLGDGNTTNRSVPTQESTHAADWGTVAAGYYHTVAIKSDGTLWAWGANGFGQLGDGTTTGSSVPVQESTHSSDWLAVSAGDSYTVAIKSDGTLWSWGVNNAGQIGDGSVTNRSVPTQENTHATDWLGISAGGSHTIATKSDGTLWAWGYNHYGQLGDGSIIIKTTPTQEITAALDWAAVVGGGSHTVAIKSNGTMWTWGNNDSMQLGLFTIVPTKTQTRQP